VNANFRYGFLGACVIGAIVTGGRCWAADLSVESGCANPGTNFSVPAGIFLKSSETFLKSATSKSGGSTSCSLTIHLNGEITPASMKQLRKVVEVSESPQYRLFLLLDLNSDGGDVWEAISTGKFLRQHAPAFVSSVGTQGHCYSSCVFLLASGWQRTVDGEVGIHRPYFTTERVQELGYDSLKKAYDAVFVQLKAFFADVNISERLLPDMWVIPSSEIRVLTDSELKDYGLSRHDAVLTEKRNADLRATCGDAAPIYQKDFMQNVIGRCGNSEGVIDTGCVNKLGGKHPYCRCFAEANPKSGFICE
jgi:hypothetical protein